MNPQPKVPLPGKIVPVVENEILKSIAFISVEEHVANCAAFLDFVSPEKDDLLTDALLFHDIGKKLFRVRRIYSDGPSRRWGYDRSRGGREDIVELLKQDYAATMRPGSFESLREGIDISEVAGAYLSFVGIRGNGRKKAAEGVKAYPIRREPGNQKSPVIAASYKLERPFGNHASPIKTEHLPDGLGNDRYLERLAALIRLHHGFQVPKIVTEAADWEDFPEYLYKLMTMDHLGSSWAERLVLREEGGSKRTFAGGVDFGEIESSLEGEPHTTSNPDGTKTVSADVRLCKHPNVEEVVPFSATYFVREVNYVDPDLLK